MSSMSKENSIVADMSLAHEGHLKIDWVRQHMPVLNRIREQFEAEQPFKGLKVSITLHLEAKTAYLAKVVKAGGAEVTITGSNPLSTGTMSARRLSKTALQCSPNIIPHRRSLRH